MAKEILIIVTYCESSDKKFQNKNWDFEIGNSYIIDPLGYITCPLGYIIDPLGYTIDPLGYTIDPLGFIIDPLGYITCPLGFIIDPLGYTIDPLGYTIDPLGYTIDSLGYITCPLGVDDKTIYIINTNSQVYLLLCICFPAKKKREEMLSLKDFCVHSL